MTSLDAAVTSEGPERHARWSELLSVLGQLCLAAFVIWSFQLESRTLFHVFLLVAAAFPVHALLPHRFRLPFFAALSLASIVVVAGPRGALPLIGIGSALIVACHLPVSFRARVTLLLVMGAALALSRAGRVPSLLPGAAWPVLGSMFMFRLAVYLHALENDTTPPTVARTVAYFFMVPNVCYPLFPVVDYTTFGRTHYDADAALIYQRGAKWIARGLVHLLIYRFVYLDLVLDTPEVRGLGDVVHAVLATYFLYLRVSGQFHIIAGILHLFGFHLPETHRLYYLASSVTDYWRRINIYWKDFMMKLVFYPSFFRLRRAGDRVALVSATLLVFFATWILHSYQWFWLRAAFPVTPQDILFWAVLGLLVVAGTLIETKRARVRRPVVKKRRWNPSLAWRTVGTFTLLSILWSLWSAESVVDWLWMWSQAGHVQPGDLVKVAALLAIGLAIGGVVWDAPVPRDTRGDPWFRRTSVQTLATLVPLAILASPPLQHVGAAPIAALVHALRSTSLNLRDRALQQKGYYEKLDGRGQLSAQAWNPSPRRPAGLLIPLSETEAYRPLAHEFLGYDLRPNTTAVVMGKLLSTNRWGMRDHDYALAKPAGTLRIALLGPSFTMGSGVADDETYDAAVEPLLNAAAPQHHYEVLNFGVAAYSLLHQMRLLDERVYQFAPDVIVVTDSRLPDGPLVAHVSQALEEGTTHTYPGLDSILARGGIRDVGTAGVPVPTEALRRLASAVGVRARIPHREVVLRVHTLADEIIAWSFTHMAREARAHGAVPLFVDGMMTLDTTVVDTPMMRAARAAGFVVISVAGHWQGKPLSTLRISDADYHPNALGMRVIAEAILEEMRQHETELHLGLARPRPD